jgi:hypothetical protein
VRWEDGKETGRLVEDEILDSAKLKALLTGESTSVTADAE